MHVISNAYEIWSENTKGKDHLENIRRRWDDSIKMELNKFSCRDVNWIKLV
jgi:hypothetical protein